MIVIKKNIIEYCQHEFLSTWASFERKMVVFAEDSLWIRSFGLKEEEKLLVLVTYNKNIFSANNKKKSIKRKKEITFTTKKKRKKSWYLSFLHLLEDCMS